MLTQSRKKIAQKLCGGVVALAAVGLVMGTAATPAVAKAASPTVTQSGTGTVSDPWIPSRNAHTDCQTTGLYGNYYNGQHLNWILDMPFDRYIVVRYITSDGRSGDVYDNFDGQWGFAPTSCWHFT